MIRRPPRSTLSSSSAASDVYKRQAERRRYADDGRSVHRRKSASHHQQVPRRPRRRRATHSATGAHCTRETSVRRPPRCTRSLRRYTTTIHTLDMDSVQRRTQNFRSSGERQNQCSDGVNTFSVRVLNRWNSLPVPAVQVNSVNCFKNQLEKLRNNQMDF